MTKGEGIATASAGYRDEVGRIEQCGIGYIPPEERRSTPHNLFVILFGGSLTFSVIIIGWLPISFGLSFGHAASAVVIGSAVGAGLLAPMGLMGPRSGTNNPVTSGAFFGVKGRIIGSLLSVSASFVFAALSIWTGGDALAGALTAYLGVDDTTLARLLAYGVLSVIITVVSVLGHASMVAAQRFMIPTAGACLVLGLLVYGRHFDASYTGGASYAFGSLLATWIASALVCGSTVVSYGAYAGDWTRHVSPLVHSDRSILRSMFLGGLFGMGGPFMWGTVTATAVAASTGDPTTPYVLGLVQTAPVWFIPALIYLGLASGTAQAVINTYGIGLDASSMVPRLTRVQATIVSCAIATVLVYVGHFSDVIETAIGVYLQLLATFAVPWIVIVAFGHVACRGTYSVEDLHVYNQRRRGGAYWFRGGVEPYTTALWIVAVLAGLLFANTELFVGPIAPVFGGVDLGWLVSGAVAGALFPTTSRRAAAEPGYEVT